MFWPHSHGICSAPELCKIYAFLTKHSQQIHFETFRQSVHDFTRTPVFFHHYNVRFACGPFPLTVTHVLPQIDNWIEKNITHKSVFHSSQKTYFATVTDHTAVGNLLNLFVITRVSGCLPACMLSPPPIRSAPIFPLALWRLAGSADSRIRSPTRVRQVSSTPMIPTLR